ncbi:MAG: protein-L-isoaspartate O-methyltransferase [Xanthomonadales bacterium]|nr:protein-L-isoaspartate O-methyltransferase [Gammaproteobacteria bacterium]MBT8073517.1 protein-L-isoaspartate O-methyltransferase [Gammaproteobacteria bacterium]MBT8075767.1 protein-L-isoaspartate O-methyltransferase [Gammaproteobacteria bacterium]NNK04359.1 protein-L-isoaspartate O-methyltransferase [Xanthomonadales bacterium]NNL00533.1 protein-L-isoaspartate O-methyltransferase [Xanthomonadales bacterium]
MSMNFEQARFNMVEQQVRPWEVLDPRVLELLEKTHREDFVPVRYRKMAFADFAVPLDHDQSMMKPVVEGRLLQSLELKEDETVLEIGTGSGFITACLAQMAKRVVSVDIHEQFTTEAEAKLKDKDIHNVELETGDAMSGWQPEQAHDVLVVTGSVDDVPDHFRGWVNPGGRMFVVCGDAPAMEAKLLTKLNATEWREESLFETDLPRLINAGKAPEFEF